jgi:D-arabinose 1-dehydrogenase-like Zn-dependent alcohol dehydrogenase
MRLVGSGRVGSVPITTRPLQEVNAAMIDLRDGHVLGRGVLIP